LDPVSGTISETQSGATPQSYNFTVQATDSLGNIGAQGFTLLVFTLSVTLNATTAPNVLLAGGSTGKSLDSTSLQVSLQPPASTTIVLSSQDSTGKSFGTIPPITTAADGTAIAQYTAGTLSFGNTAATTTNIAATVYGTQVPNVLTCVPKVSPCFLYNYNGFDFHQSQVSDTEFVNVNALSAAGIQAFFDGQNTFLTKFYFVGAPGCQIPKGDTKVPCGGFISDNGIYATGDPVYSANGQQIPPGSQGTPASAFVGSIAQQYGINPEILLATMQKEQTLISKYPCCSTMPPTDTLNHAMGCGDPPPLAFQSQLSCAAKSFITHFSYPNSYPFFFPPSTSPSVPAPIYLRWPQDPNPKEIVTFAVQNAATYTQYTYTNYIETSVEGGVYSFEYWWAYYQQYFINAGGS
jgi:hypothetical protein